MDKRTIHQQRARDYILSGVGATFFDLAFEGEDIFIQFKNDQSTELTILGDGVTCLVPSSAINLSNLRFLSVEHKGTLERVIIGYLTPKKGHKVLVDLLIPLKDFLRYSSAIFAKFKECRGEVADNGDKQPYSLTYTLKEGYMEELVVQSRD